MGQPIETNMPVSKQTTPPLKSYWTSDCGRITLYLGKCEQVLPQLVEQQFHTVVTDPPYGLEFMGKDWDAPWKNTDHTNAKDRQADELDDPTKAKYLRHNVEYVRDGTAYQKWFQTCAMEILRVAKPGAHLLAFGGTRMWHRMVCAIEDAGFEIRDTIAWIYGSGFPKSLNISQAIDKMLGAERTEVIGVGTDPIAQGQFNSREVGAGGYGYKSEYEVKAPATDAAKQWYGWGTGLKPAIEPISVSRRPTAGSVAENVLEHGCGGMNLNDCRVGTTGTDVEKFIATKKSSGSGIYQFNSGDTDKVGLNGDFIKVTKDGTLPTNLIHDGSPEVVESMPAGACRYFYSAKADASDRAHAGDTVHPTVKPLDLMKYLVRLVCAKGGTVLDPFMGSGSTGCACLEEGMYFVGIEQNEDYIKLAVDRMKEMLGLHSIVKRLESGKRIVNDTPPPARKLR